MVRLYCCPVAIFVLSVVSIIIISIRAVRKVFDENSILHKEKNLILIFLFVTIFSFVMPRFKDYDYVLLIAPAFFIINKSDFIKPLFFLTFILILESTRVTLPGFKTGYKLLWSYYPLFSAILVWILYLIYIKKYSTEDFFNQSK